MVNLAHCFSGLSLLPDPRLYTVTNRQIVIPDHRPLYIR